MSDFAVIGDARLPKIVAGAAFVVAMLASAISSHAESTVLAQQRIVSSADAQNPLEIKGRVFFVTDEQRLAYTVGRDVFMASVAILFAAIAIGKRKRMPLDASDRPPFP